MLLNCSVKSTMRFAVSLEFLLGVGTAEKVLHIVSSMSSAGGKFSTSASGFAMKGELGGSLLVFMSEMSCMIFRSGNGRLGVTFIGVLERGDDDMSNYSID